MYLKRGIGIGWVGIITLVAIILVSVGLAARDLLPVTAQQPQLLNPGFESGFRAYGGIGELNVANEWRPWYVESGGHHRPEYQPESHLTGSGRVREGAFAQKQHTTYARQDGGLVQEVATVPDEWYTFSAWVYAWSTNSDNPDSSPGPTGSYSALVGINPWGDCRATYRTTVWGKEVLRVYNEWVQVSVTAQAWSDKVCVFTRGAAVYATKHNDSYFDDLSFVRVESPSGQPTPTPGPTPEAEDVDYVRIRDIVREELDRTRLTH